jgi:hypothetical protein
MSLQTASYNQPYAMPVGNQGWTVTASVPSPSGYAGNTTTGMTQLPIMPQPPFLNNASNLTGGTQAGLAPMPEIPSPWQIAPSVMGTSGNAPPYNLAQSVPVSAGVPYVESVAEIPPPHMVAPWLYIPRPNQMPTSPYGNQNLNGQNGLNGMNGQNGMQGQQPQQPPQQPQQQPPQQPPQQPQQKAPSANLDAEFNDVTINSLNERLNNPNEDIRADAAMDLYKILEGSPTLVDNPNYAKYINAFMDKIMQDPSPIVRGAGEFILEMGKVPNPSDLVKSRLKSLSERPTMTGEDVTAGSILGKLQSGTLRKTPPVAAPQAGQGQPQGAGQPGAPGQPGQTTTPGQTQGQQQGGSQGQPQQPMPTDGAQGQGGIAQQGFQAPQGQAQQGQTGIPPQQGGMTGLPGYGMPQQPMDPQQLAALQGYGQGGGLPMPQQPGAGYFPQQPQYQQQQQPWGLPQTGSNPNIGGRLNMISSPQGISQGMPQNLPMMQGQGYPQTGQRLNIQEGRR